jgi:serine protease inhibitor
MLAAAMLFGCTNDGSVRLPMSRLTRLAFPPRVSERDYGSFAFDFIHTLQETQPAGDNLFVSPLSLHMALGMLAERRRR